MTNGLHIDVLVPVHGAGQAFRRCASSLARHVNPDQHRVVVILDGPGDQDTKDAINELQRARLTLTVLEHAEPQGFVASVNRGLSVSDLDVVLLNSDTQVTSRWLEKLRTAAYADARTATVTPFSNNATICSLPVFLAENTIPVGYDLETFAALVERCAARVYPKIPTGVGACLYVKREVLREVGAFSDVFGLGYGEETDFCLRASARGYHHVLDDATFIFHEGSRSFGVSRARRVRRAGRLVAKRHPDYERQLVRFIREDPLADARGRVLTAIRPNGRTSPSPSGRVLHLVHGWPPWAAGGTELYAHWLAHEQSRRQREVAVYARLKDTDRLLGDVVEHLDHEIRVHLIVNNFVQRNPICRNGFHCTGLARDFARHLDDVRPDILHVHHLAGHCASLLGVARRRGIRILYQAQDWWPICARSNLIDRDHAFCSGPNPGKCARCLPLTSLPPATVLSSWLHRARRLWIRAQLRSADAVVMGSRFIAESYRHERILADNIPVHVVSYGVPSGVWNGDVVNAPKATRSGAALRFGYIGALLPHKGVHVCVEAFKQLCDEPVELHIWGRSDDAVYSAAIESAAGVRIHVHGSFPESEKPSILRSLDALIVPSTGLESFGLVAREAMRYGVPVIASRRGALNELFDEGDDHGGTFFVPDDPADLARQVRRLINSPGLLDRWRRSIPPITTVEQHADEIDEIYRSLNKPRRR